MFATKVDLADFTDTVIEERGNEICNSAVLTLVCWLNTCRDDELRRWSQA